MKEFFSSLFGLSANRPRERDDFARKWLQSRRAALDPDSRRKATVRRRLLSQLKPRSQGIGRGSRPVGFRLGMAGVAVVVLLLSMFGIVDASAAALPGDDLFPIKLLVEDLRMAAALTPEARSDVLAERIDARLLEIVQLQSRSDEAGVAEGLSLLKSLLLQSEAIPASLALEASLAHSQEVLVNVLSDLTPQAQGELEGVLQALHSASEKAGMPPFSDEPEPSALPPERPTTNPTPTLTAEESAAEETPEIPGAATDTAVASVTPTSPGNSGGPPSGTPGAGNGNSDYAHGREDEHPGRGNSGGDDEDDSTNGTPPGHGKDKKNEDKIKGGKD